MTLSQKRTSETLENRHIKVLTLAVMSLSDKLRDFIRSWRLEELERGHWYSWNHSSIPPHRGTL